MIVVDASAVLDALLSVDGLDPLASHQLIAPALLRSEVTAALREAAWRRVLSRDAVLEGLARLAGAPIDFSSPEGLHREAWLVAEQLGWAKTYDAEYVALAKLTRARLLTRDARLKRAAGHLVDIVGPTEI